MASIINSSVSNMVIVVMLMFHTFVSSADLSFGSISGQLPAGSCMMQSQQVTGLSGGGDNSGIAAALINCLSNHITDLSSVMTLLSAGSQHVHQSLKPYKTCVSSLARAKQELKTVKTKLVHHDHLGAYQSMSNVLVDNFKCKSAITSGTFQLKTTLLNKLNMLEQLGQMAKNAIHQQ